MKIYLAKPICSDFYFGEKENNNRQYTPIHADEKVSWFWWAMPTLRMKLDIDSNFWQEYSNL